MTMFLCFCAINYKVLIFDVRVSARVRVCVRVCAYVCISEHVSVCEVYNMCPSTYSYQGCSFIRLLCEHLSTRRKIPNPRQINRAGSRFIPQRPSRNFSPTTMRARILPRARTSAAIPPRARARTAQHQTHRRALLLIHIH